METSISPTGRSSAPMRLFHRTDMASARRIVDSGRFISLCQDSRHAFFSDRPDGVVAAQYGPVIVEIRVSAEDAVLDESYSSYGEKLYRVPLDAIGPANIIGIVGNTAASDRPVGASAKEAQTRTL